MRGNFLLSVFVFICFLTSAQTEENDQKWPKKLPHGTVVISGLNILMDQYEVSVGNWFAFLFYLKNQKGNEEALQYMPSNESVPERYRTVFERFRKILSFKKGHNYEVMRLSLNLQPFPWYKNDPEYEEAQIFAYPVTGIKHEWAEKYLIWQESVINSDKNARKINNGGYVLKAALLSLEQWEEMAPRAGLRDIGNEGVNPDSVNTHGCYLMNVKYKKGCESMENMSESYGEEAFPVAAFFPDAYGLYDIYGNVAEMVEEQGVSIGGSYFHWAECSFPGKTINYNKEEKWLGFRCVYTLIKK